MMSRLRGGRRRGAVTVEFALMVPVVIFMFLFATTMCRMTLIKHTAENAAYEACRRGAVPGATAAQVTASARTILTAIGASTATVTVSPTTITSSTTEVSVTVRVPLSSGTVTTALSSLFGSNYVESRYTMQRESLE